MRDCHILHLIAEMANSKVYKIRNNVNVFRAEASTLHIISASEPQKDNNQEIIHVDSKFGSENSKQPGDLVGQDSRQVELILQTEFFDRVLPDL